MYDGSEKLLKDITPGDKVINAKGGITEVSCKTEDEYEGDVISIKCYGMSKKCSIDVTPEHPFYVLRKDKIKRIRYENKVHIPTRLEIDFSPEWVEAKDIKEGDLLIVPKIQHDSNSVSVSKARLLGYYLAEGNPNYKPRKLSPPILSNITWTLGVHEQHLLEELVSLIEEETGEKPYIYGPYESAESVYTIRTRVS